MNILFVLENYIPHIGGVEVLFKHICETLAKKHKVTVITHRLKGTESFEIINGVNVVRVDVPHFLSRYFFTFMSIPTIIRYAKSADIIHTSTYNAAPPAKFVSWLQNKPCVITIHEVIGNNWSSMLEMNWLSGKLHQFLEWLIISLKFDRYICISYSTKNDLIEVKAKNKSTVIYCGIDYDFFNPKKYGKNNIKKKLNLEDNFVYLFYGRPGVSKGLEFLLRAVPIIKSKIKNSKLLAILSTDKTYRRQYKTMMKLINKLHIENDVMIIPPVKRDVLPSYIMASDCVVVPSLTEGFGFAVAESCALGKPVIASEVKSIPEVISGKYVLVKPRDPGDIARAVVRVFNREYTKCPLKKFTWKECISKYEKLYKEVLANR
jgi:D-inositol-3-phosphate glycosyltransferase